jgi:two-component system sensor histidine kinase KdpD
MSQSSTYRGDLQILLGAAPGVGKTYAMLNEGQRLLAEGHDVVIGYVETHGRADTDARIGNLETIPRRVVRHGTLEVPEMDVDAIVRRRPQIVLVDELAHTNAPGSVRAKRYEDVEFLRDRGIDVITTVNVQHIAELQDVVSGITGVEVRESVPDRILAGATDVQLIDLPVEVLLRRLEQGKIYPPERTTQALTGFFREGNLTALRELALRRTASGVDRQLTRMMLGLSPSDLPAERILVLVNPHPRWGDVLRNAWRLASATHADLLVLAMVPGGDITNLPPAEREAIERHLQLASDLGATQLVHADAMGSTQDDARIIAGMIRQERITILAGGITRTRKRFRAGWSGLDLLTTVLELTEGVDVHLVEMK